LSTSHSKAAEAFYRQVIGWEVKDSGATAFTYTFVSVGEQLIGGIMPLSSEACEAPMKPGWVGYIGVDDVDAYAAKVVAQGGSLLRSPMDIPEVGRFSVVADPYGAVFILFKGTRDDEPVSAPPRTPGHIGWHELHAGNGQGAFDFYAGLFGWTKAEAIDMGPMGVYQTFATGGAPVGGMMTKMPDSPSPFWLYYFNVEAIDPAVDRVKKGGGQILMGPHQVPGGDWIAQGTDPQGAMFAMVATKR
jgi:hypothetical protein